MKKLTPFQKKVARWCGKHDARDSVGAIIFIACMGSTVFIAPMVIMGNIRLRFLMAIWFMTIFILIKIGGVEKNRNQLPEIQAEKAEAIVKENPEYAERINGLIQGAFARDDGGELKEALEKFKIMVSKEKSLADLPNQAAKLKIEIAALEKELGL